MFWCADGVLYYELLRDGETITSDVYCRQLTALSEAIKANTNLPFLLRRRSILLHDNARPHVAKKFSAKLKELNIEVLPHPPYSPDMAPTDYYMFRSMQHSLAEAEFETYEEVDQFLQGFFLPKLRIFTKRVFIV